MKLWVLMNSKTICLQASKTKPCGEGVCVLVLQAAGQERARARGAEACMRCSEEPG